jgi:S-DNA-T family DNA segregation ATPase FtsK/SpoIIIE
LPFDATEPREVERAWRGHEHGLTCPIGITADGILAVDLVADGPHALVAGTTGAGKSELLRSLVLGLAASRAPEDLELALIDFKGGSTFAELSSLPHVVGAVTDLDGSLARRAVLALEGELRRRELLLERRGAGDIATYRALPGPPEPLPRLVVVIDEFATLAADHPDVLDGFVSVAQRGRSLGLHLVLATQRPTGSVNDHLRANTNLRVALRVQDPADSRDVLDVADAAEIRRDQPGRALVRLGPGELVPVQVATTAIRAAHATVGVEIRARRVPTCGSAPAIVDAAADGHPGTVRSAGSVAAIIGAIGEAQRRRGGRAAPALWPDPLPDRVALEQLWSLDGHLGQGSGRARAGEHELDPPATACTSAFAVADDPAGQRRRPVTWQPGDGNLLVLGAPGSGASSALAAACLSAARTDPHALHVYVLTMGGPLQPLAGLAHTGAVAGAREADRRRRLLRLLRAELDERINGRSSGRPALMVLIDGAAALLAASDDPFDPTRPTIERLLTDGPGVGIQVALSAERPAGLPPSWLAVIRQRLVLHLAEPADLALAGVPRSVALPAVPGRGWWSSAGLVVQTGDPGEALAALVAHPQRRLAPADGGPRPVGVLPRRVRAADLACLDSSPAERHLDREPLVLPVGIAESDLRPASLALHPGEHALVIGPPRSGRSALLAGLAEVACTHTSTSVVATLTAGRETVHPWPDRCVALHPLRWVDQLSELAAGGGPVLALIDDAHRLDAEGPLELLKAAGPHLHLVVSVTNTALRASFGHWTRRLAESRTAVLLCPDVDLDGELFGVRLPRRAPARGGVGRGWLVADGAATYVQALG